MGVLVVGMHRSGTSALSSVLEATGLDAGTDLMARDVGNPDGYYEQRGVVALDDEVLAHYGGAWDAPPLLAPGWTEEHVARGFARRAREVLDETFSRPRFVMKDPRVSLLLPLWRHVLLDRCAAVVIVRDPAEVAWSLALRDAMSPLSAMALWSAYNRALLEGLEGLPVHVVRYAELVERPAAVVGEVVASLRDWGEVAGDVDEVSAAARVKPDLRRDTHPGEGPLASPPEEIRALDDFLGGLCGRHDSFVAAATPSAGWWEAALLDERRTVRQSAEARVAAVESQRDEVVRDNEALRAQSAELRREMEAALAALEEMREARSVSRWDRLAGRGR
ncbi:MAG: sulfotransferase family protein [Acidimicrobiales bacterium]